MSCPDNLLIGSRKGALSAEEQAQLDVHLARCPTCLLTLQVGADFDAVLETVPGDDLIAARFARSLGPKFVKERVQRRGDTLRYAWVAAALLATVAGAGLAAASLGAWPFAKAPKAQVDLPEPAAVRVRKPTHEAPPPREPAPTAEPAQTRAVEPTQTALSVQHAASAAELFARANAQRREGAPSRARGLYQKLQQLYPRSAEVEVSFVSLGRVQLELGAAGQALAQFERYLVRRPRGPLAEEALFGQASALERLRRPAAERRTWETLLATFPNSLYADRARHRLEQIP